ncbi:hypothetical protein [Mucilaginibacter defluvii]|uniref:Uncharacterized protein n=1 Tax=Mucilaginibacter defluvii TaxID=1196019 RepID=A0ABP9FWE0_9SPHI
MPGIGEITIELNLEDSLGTDELKEIADRATSWLNQFNGSVLQELKMQIVAELTDAARLKFKAQTFGH